MTDIDRTSLRGATTGERSNLAGQGARPGAVPRASFGPTDDLIRRVADTDITVLIQGERGTGKEVAARAIHAGSARRDQPFVKVACGTLPDALEAELFGHDGSRAGAGPHRPGRIQFASHGTLFLDGVGELPLPLQLRLDQVLHDRDLARAGRPRGVPMEARVIASTEQDLGGAVTDGRFRMDLYQRLNVLCLTLTPLRQRKDELPALTDFFLKQYSVHFNKSQAALSEATLQRLTAHDWPGNLQELDTLVKRIVMLGTEDAVPHDLERPPEQQTEGIPGPPLSSGPGASTSHPVPPMIRSGRAASPTPVEPVPLKELARQAAESAERELIFRTLQHTRWNRRAAAEMLGVSYKALLYKIKRAELDGAC